MIEPIYRLYRIFCRRSSLYVVSILSLLALSAGCVPVENPIIENSENITGYMDGYIVTQLISVGDKKANSKLSTFSTNDSGFISVKMDAATYEFGLHHLEGDVYYSESTYGSIEDKLGGFVVKSGNNLKYYSFGMDSKYYKTAKSESILRIAYSKLLERGYTFDNLAAFYRVRELTSENEPPVYEAQFFPMHEKAAALALVDEKNAAIDLALKAERARLESEEQARAEEKKQKEQAIASAAKTESARKNANNCLKLSYNRYNEKIFVTNSCDEKLTVQVCLKSKGDTAVDIFKELVGAGTVMGHKTESWSCDEYFKGKGPVANFNWSGPNSIEVIKWLSNDAYKVSATRR